MPLHVGGGCVFIFIISKDTMKNLYILQLSAQLFSREISIFLPAGMGFLLWIIVRGRGEAGARGWGWGRKKDKSSEIQKYFSFGEDIRPF